VLSIDRLSRAPANDRCTGDIDFATHASRTINKSTIHNEVNTARDNNEFSVELAVIVIRYVGMARSVVVRIAQLIAMIVVLSIGLSEARGSSIPR